LGQFSFAEVVEHLAPELLIEELLVGALVVEVELVEALPKLLELGLKVFFEGVVAHILGLLVEAYQ